MFKGDMRRRRKLYTYIISLKLNKPIYIARFSALDVKTEITVETPRKGGLKDHVMWIKYGE
jgi:hypothetical protein